MQAPESLGVVGGNVAVVGVLGEGILKWELTEDERKEDDGEGKDVSLVDIIGLGLLEDSVDFGGHVSPASSPVLVEERGLLGESRESEVSDFDLNLSAGLVH